MPIILFGSRGLTSEVERGEFYCPRCDRRDQYSLKASREWFTLYFIPVFPIGGLQRYVECRGCGQAFTEDVLQMEQPDEFDRLLARMQDEMLSGTSLVALKNELVEMGVEPPKADAILERMCDGRTRDCPCGERFHPRVKKCYRCGAAL